MVKELHGEKNSSQVSPVNPVSRPGDSQVETGLGLSAPEPIKGHRPTARPARNSGENCKLRTTEETKWA